MTVGIELLGRQVQRALIIRWGGLGDLIMASAVFEDLYQNLPGVEIHLNTEPPWNKLFENDPRFNSVISIKLRGSNSRLCINLNCLKKIRQGNYDLIIDLQSNDRSRILLSLLAMFCRQNILIVGTKKGFPYDVSPGKLKSGSHALEYFRSPLIGLAIPVKACMPKLYIPRKFHCRVQKLIHENDIKAGEFTLFAPGSSKRGIDKRWGEKRYVELAAKLREHGVKQIVLVGAEADKTACENIARTREDWVINLCGKTEILDIYLLAGAARNAIGNDTGTNAYGCRIRDAHDCIIWAKRCSTVPATWPKSKNHIRRFCIVGKRRKTGQGEPR